MGKKNQGFMSQTGVQNKKNSNIIMYCYFLHTFNKLSNRTEKSGDR